MKTILTFNIRYFLLFIALLIIEILIALYVHDEIIRPYIGDVLVSILVYCFVKAFFNTPVFKTALYVLLFSYAVEISQYFHLVARLGLSNSKLAKIIMGSSFGWIDMAAYTVGILIVLVVEGIANRRVINK